jgi:ferrous iron transport protein B
MVVWSTGLAYLTATLFYQLATFGEHPETSTTWLVGIAAIVAVIVLAFRYWGGRHNTQPEI